MPKFFMQHVTGIGGVFLKAKDPKALAAWYDKHLGFSFGKSLYVSFTWVNENNPAVPGNTAFSFFKNETTYFDPSLSPFMINFRVKDLVTLLGILKQEGVEVVGEMQEEEYGKFGWIMDPEGNKVELWEPVDDKLG
jgi:predicted enzyme related to lactoylglutathione lyase